MDLDKIFLLTPKNLRRFLKNKDVSNKDIEDILKSFSISLPKLLRVNRSNRGNLNINGVIFNSLVLAWWSSDSDKIKLSHCVDTYSLFRLAVSCGGQTITIPTVEEIIVSYVAILGCLFVYGQDKNPYYIYGNIKKLLDYYGISSKFSYEDWKNLIKTEKEFLEIIISASNKSSEPIAEKLNKSLFDLEKASGLIEDKLLKNIDDPDILLDLHEKLDNNISTISTFLENLLHYQVS